MKEYSEILTVMQYPFIGIFTNKMNENMKQTIETMPVLIICPICDNSTMAKDLNTLDDTIHKIWKLSAEWMKEFFGENSSSMALATAGIQNKKENQIKTILKEGYLKIMCRTCISDLSQKQYEESGMNCIRIGNMIFETNFYNKNRKMIQQQRKEKPHLFIKTFWT